MKKTLIFILIAYLSYFSISTITDYSAHLSAAVTNKTAIEIEKPNSMDNEQFVLILTSIAEELNSDILLKKVVLSNGRYVSQYYTTLHQKEFIAGLSEKNYVKLKQENAIHVSNLFEKDVLYASFDEIVSFDLTKNQYYVSTGAFDSWAEKLQASGINNASINEASLLRYMITPITQIYPLFLVTLCMIFFLLDKRKLALVKRLNGYGMRHIVCDEIKQYSKLSVALFFSVGIITWTVHTILLPNEVLGFFQFLLFQFLVLFCILFLLFGTSCLICFLKSAQLDLKGKNNLKLLFLVSFGSKIVLSCLLILQLSSAVTTAIQLGHLKKTQDIVSQKITDYVQVPLNFSMEYFGNSIEEITRINQKCLTFYHLTVDEFHGVLIHSTNYQGSLKSPSLADTDQQNSITINENYLDLNPIYTPDGDAITKLTLNKNDDAFNLLIPDNMTESIPDIKQQYVTWYQDYGLTDDRISVTIYHSKSKLYSYNAFVQNDNGGLMESPIVEVFNEKYLGHRVINYFGRSYLLRASTQETSEEIFVSIEEAGLQNIILVTPSVLDGFAEMISALRIALLFALSSMLVAAVGLVALLIYSPMLYSTINRKKITIKRINGFHFTEIHHTYFIVQSLISSILLFGLVVWFEASIVVCVVVLVVELVLFCFQAKRYERSNMVSIMKEGD